MRTVVHLIIIGYAIASLSTPARTQNQWKELQTPTDKLLYKLSFLDTLRGWVCGFEGAMLKTTDGGRTWEIQDAGVDTDLRRVFALNDRLVWALTFEHFVDTGMWFGTRILKTTNGGTDWSNEQYPECAEFFNALFFKDSLNGWMGGEFGRLVRTTNGGASWFRAQVDSSVYDRWALINIKFLTPTLGFAMGGRIDIVGVIWKTTDGGVRWMPDGPSPEPIHDVHMVNASHLVAITGDVDFGASMLHSKNGGETWDYTFLNIFGEPLALSFRTPNEAWVPLGFAARMMYTTDTARTWTVIDTPHRRPIYDLVFLDSLTGFAVGDSGTILKYDPSPVDVVENPGLLPPAYVLHQNFPNPFNPATTISFELPRESFVTLTVHNVLGEEVRTLLNERRSAGQHLLSFNAATLSSGVYFYRLTAGGFTGVKKMLLVR